MSPAGELDMLMSAVPGVPGLDYPSVTNLYCVNAQECRDYAELGPGLDPLGLMDNFDHLNWVLGDTFQYFCSMDGKGGWQTS